jgi:hypothetical protein
MKKDHPYRQYEKLRLWKVLTRAVKDLESNGDVEAKTARRYIVGYLSKLLVESDLIRDDPKEGSAQRARIGSRSSAAQSG